VRRLADTIRQRTDRLDILINNTGIGTAGASRQTSADGHELRFAVNDLTGCCQSSARARRRASSMSVRQDSRRSTSPT
jgi:NAD(P)-dependent dehydrogenase (short-subunit alcohol dehydrogenase family)